MEKDKKSTLLLVASILGFVYWIIMVVTGWRSMVTGWRSMGINFSDIQVVFFEGFMNLVKNGGIKWVLLLLLIVLVLIAPSVLNLIGWKKNSKKLVIAAIILYFLSFNALSLLICLIDILWDKQNEFDINEKKKNPLLLIAGIFGLLMLVFWVVPLMEKADGSGSDSLFSALFSNINDPGAIIAVKVMALYYVIALIASFIISIAISFFGKLRNNSKKVLLAAISYIISMSLFSALLCFIAYPIMKHKSKEAK